jgi:sugar lactone lactonase YvrE
VNAGNVTGGVYEWHPGGELALVPGTELSGANGIALSDDERYMYVAAIGGAELVRFDRRATPVTKENVALPIRPDNVRWGDDGKLYTAGGDREAPASCAMPPYRPGWSVVAVDPSTLAVERVTGAPAGVALSGVSVALPVGDEIWIGTFRGNRVGILPRP